LSPRSQAAHATKAKRTRKTARWDAFISHSSQDKLKVRRLTALLSAKRLKPWIDQTGVQFGGLLRNGLQDAIAASKSFVLVWSKAASGSRWVIAELLTAFHLGRFIIPCVLDGTRMPQFLRNTAYLDRKRDGGRLGEMLVAAVRGVPDARNAIMPFVAAERAEVLDLVNPIARAQYDEVTKLRPGHFDESRRIHAAVDKQVAAALQRFPLESKVLNVAGYHAKNAYMLKHYEAIQAGQPPEDPLLQKAERCFFSALLADPNNAEALNGVGNVLFFEGELDASEFFHRCALKSAKQKGFHYAEAQHDLDLVLSFKKRSA
jgi:tetratricopeptide (TPR) repeat protein